MVTIYLKRGDSVEIPKATRAERHVRMTPGIATGFEALACLTDAGAEIACFVFSEVVGWAVGADASQA